MHSSNKPQPFNKQVIRAADMLAYSSLATGGSAVLAAFKFSAGETRDGFFALIFLLAFGVCAWVFRRILRKLVG